MQEVVVSSPPPGKMLIGYNKNWVDDEYNPSGICECFVDDDGNWTFTKWNIHTDEFDTIKMLFDQDQFKPSHWSEMPQLQLEFSYSTPDGIRTDLYSVYPNIDGVCSCGGRGWRHHTPLIISTCPICTGELKQIENFEEISSIAIEDFIEVSNRWYHRLTNGTEEMAITAKAIIENLHALEFAENPTLSDFSAASKKFDGLIEQVNR
jgi:hypothetical protein